jgi:prevent-host-death family protein
MSRRMKTKTMAASEFRAKCLALMDEVQAKHISVVITKRGKPVAKLVPVEAEKDEIFDFMKGKVRILGDIVSPVFAEDEWDCLK